MTAKAGGTSAGASTLAPWLAPVAAYYSDKVRRYGATPAGVDWPCEATQQLRFSQLLKVCDFGGGFSLNDVGCGYGALLSHLSTRHSRHPVDYLGTDLSEEMIAAASRRWSRRRTAHFRVARDTSRTADYSVASGVFNVKLDSTDQAWVRGIKQTLARMRSDSRRGLAVNFIDAALCSARIPQIYYADAEWWASHCERHLGVDVEIVSGYGLREFTLLMRCRT